MPRALLEAMARGLACLATPVGGVPQLLPAEALVPVGDAAALARAIAEVAGDEATRSRWTDANRATAARYAERVLAPRRVELYEAVRGAVAVTAR
jgi:glycosyltransferase involved in cell wall biosynthesis